MKAEGEKGEEEGDAGSSGAGTQCVIGYPISIAGMAVHLELNSFRPQSLLRSNSLLIKQILMHFNSTHTTTSLT